MLITKSGKIIAAGDDWSPIEEYAAKNKTKVASASILPVVNGMGKLWVHWKDGAVGTFDAVSMTELLDYIKTLKGWPKVEMPRMFAGPLPFIVPMADEEEPPAKKPEPVAEVVDEAPVRVRRSRRK